MTALDLLSKRYFNTEPYGHEELELDSHHEDFILYFCYNYELLSTKRTLSSGQFFYNWIIDEQGEN